jgi:CDP-diacylglycerol--glycerol-3-phosphate 3-phosphatidyltransferase
MSIYALKPRFQDALRPLVTRLHRAGVTANGVTLATCAVSVTVGAGLSVVAARGGSPLWFLVLPAWLFLRMAANAIDGMLAKELGQRTRLGAYLNELTDVVSDAALYLPFAWALPGGGAPVAAVIWLAALTELAGLAGPVAGASRRYDGPMGKSDRAFVFGALAVWVALAGRLPGWSAWIVWAVAALCAWTVVRRVRLGLAEAQR